MYESESTIGLERKGGWLEGGPECGIQRTRNLFDLLIHLPVLATHPDSHPILHDKGHTEQG